MHLPSLHTRMVLQKPTISADKLYAASLFGNHVCQQVAAATRDMQRQYQALLLLLDAHAAVMLAFGCAECKASLLVQRTRDDMSI